MTESETTPSALTDAMAQGHVTSQFVGFRLADQDYAFRIEQIQEIVIPDQITRLPQVPAYVDGVTNLRGTIIPLINLRRLFGIEEQSQGAPTRAIVVNLGDRTIGCTVDDVSQVIRLSDEDIQPASSLPGSQQAEHIFGFARHHDSMLVILNINELLSPDKLDAVHQAATAGDESARGSA